MANVCLYKIKVKGTKKACYKLVDMMPLYSGDKEYLSAEGTEEDFTLVFLGDCKWSVDSYTVFEDKLKPYTEEELDKVSDGFGWNYPLINKSTLLNCEIFCNSKDIDDKCYSNYVHYNRGKEIFDECPKELHIKAGRDYDKDCDEYIVVDLFNKEPSLPKPTCKVRFVDNYSYWYLGDYKIGDLVYVGGVKSELLGQVKDVSDTFNSTAIYNVVKHIGNVGIANREEIAAIWTSYKAKDRKVYLKSIGLEETINKNKFIALIENRWIEFAQKENDWDKFISSIKETA